MRWRWSMPHHARNRRNNSRLPVLLLRPGLSLSQNGSQSIGCGHGDYPSDRSGSSTTVMTARHANRLGSSILAVRSSQSGNIEIRIGIVLLCSGRSSFCGRRCTLGIIDAIGRSHVFNRAFSAAAVFVSLVVEVFLVIALRPR